MSSLISVLMSVYNAEKYLEESIQSILNQTYSNFEFIIVNDGSTDKSLEIIQKYEKLDNRIILISRKNKGLIASLNEGILMANGKYIARMDADDISLSTRLQEQLKIMESNNNIVVCGTWIKQFGENIKSSIEKYHTFNKDIKAHLLISCCFAHPSVMIKKEAFLNNNISYDYSYKDAEDYHLWTQLAKVGDFYNIPKVLLYYRYLHTSISRIADQSKNEIERKRIHKNIYKEAMKLIACEASDDELELSFIISSKKRIQSENIDLENLIIYFNKIIKLNKHSSFANNYTLCRILGKRWLLVFLVRKEFKQIFSKYFFYGILSIFHDKFFIKLLIK